MLTFFTRLACSIRSRFSGQSPSGQSQSWQHTHVIARTACSVVLSVLFVVGALPARAALIQHLDASVTASVVTNGSGVVTQWLDQSGAGNHATPAVGSVKYPSVSVSASGRKGLDFGATRNSLTLFSSTASDSWLNCATNTAGFCVLVAFKSDGFTADWSDLIGNSSQSASGFGMRYGTTGSQQVYLGGGNLAISGTLAATDTVVMALNYDAASGSWFFWNSKSNSVQTGIRTAADFSTALGVTLGSVDQGGRFLNGMVGEVKVYNAALSASAFKAERDALALKWANQTPPLSVNWRVIPDDANYPTDDVLMAAVSISDAGYTNPLPANPATTDCTATFQEAIDVVSAAGGGTVFVPAGEYRLNGNLTVKNNVTLRGRWAIPSATKPVTGTILKVYNNRNNATATPFITLQACAGVRDMAFWHPEQTASAIVPYPFVILSSGKYGSVENVTMVNPYQGMDFSTGSYLNMRNVYGSPLYRGYLVDQGFAVPRMEGARFSPNYWAWSGLAGAPAVGGPHATFMKSNGIAILIRDLDAGHVLFSEISGYNVGLKYESSPITGDSGIEQTIMGNNFTNCTTALVVDALQTLKILRCTFDGTDYGVRHVNSGSLFFTECSISGGIKAVQDDVVTGKQAHHFNFQNCTISGEISVATNGALGVVECDFVRTGSDVVLNTGVTKAIISGCTFADGPNITNLSGATAANFQISHTPVVSLLSPPFPTTYDKVRKPDNSTVFNVLDYGAIGNGVFDDTVAIQAALAAAKLNSGGIVFFPAGKYRMTANLSLGAGIELRGVHGGRHGPDNTTLGSLITINHGMGSDAGAAFITLGDRSGIRGLTFHYPDQSYLTPYPYPFMIRCKGNKNYLIDDAGTNAYQAVDLNNADDHLVEYTFFGAWKKAYQIGGGTENGRIQNLHVKWDFWRDSGLDGYPSTQAEHSRGEVTCGKYLDTFTLNDCTNQTLSAIFNHTCHTFVTQNGGTGAAYGIGAEELQRGYVFNTAPATGRFDFVVCAVNVYNHGDWTGKYAFQVNSTFNGDAVFFNTYFRGNPESLVSSSAGNLILQQGDFDSGGSRGITTIQAGGNVTMDNCVYRIPLDLEVPTGGSMKSSHTHFDGGYGNTDGVGVVTNSLNTYAGSVITADINDVTPRARGITIDASNVAPIFVNALTQDSPSGTRSLIDYESQLYAFHRVSGNSSIRFNVTDPDFINGAAGALDIKIQYLDDTDGTINVYYDSTSGEKLAASIPMSSTDTVLWTNATIQVSDARFNSATSDIRIEIVGASADPVFSHVSVESDRFLGLPVSTPPYDQWANLYGGTGVIGSPTNDYDRDGMVNLLEYALGTVPTDATSLAPPVVGMTGTPARLTLSYVRARADVTYVVEASTDLVGWDTVSTNPGTVGQSVSVTDLVDLDSTTTKRFLRLRVTVP